MKIISLSIMTIFLIQCTAETSFRGGGRSRRTNKDYSDATKEEVADALPSLETDLGAGALSTKVVRNYKTHMQSEFWLMTTGGKIIRSVIDPQAEIMVDPTKTKEWSFNLAGGGGARTYMLEGGAFIGAREGGHLYWLNKDTPTNITLNDGLHPENYFQVPNVIGRMCVVSYKRNGARYLGVSVHPKGFVEIEMQNVAPFKPTWNITYRDDNAFVNETGSYGAYTCYMDQVNGIMHSGALSDTSVYGYDVINRRSIGKTDSKIAYAMSGDNKGNLMSDVGMYIKSATHEKKADRYWFTDGSVIYNAAPDCVVNKTRNCQTAPGTVSTTIPGFSAQAISGLPEGIIAISYAGDAYYVKYDGKDFHTTRLLMIP